MTTSSKSGRKNAKKIIYIIYFALLLSLGVLIYVLPKVSDAFTRTYTIEYGSLQVSSEVNCYVVRNENVYVANRSGVIQYYVEEGTKLRKGAKVLDIVSGETDHTETKYPDLLERMNGAGESLNTYSAQQNGIVSYYIDGYEKVFAPDKLESLNREAVLKMELGVENLTRNTTLSGEPLYKIADNNLWHAVFWVDEKEMIKFEVGKNVTIELPLGSVSARVASISDEDSSWKIILESNQYYKNLSQVRKTGATVITEDYSGLVLPNESITSVEGQMGVYVKDIGGDFVFLPVKVIASDGEYSLVQEGEFDAEVDGESKRLKTVNVYDEILRSGKL